MSNGVYHHPGQPQMQVEVILASQVVSSVYHKPIYTIRMRYPRPIHAEIMTHRVFGRNARSSRAVPVKTMLNEVRNTPYVPWHWGKNQKGMQASEECNESVMMWSHEEGYTASREPRQRVDAWLEARDFAADTAEAFMEAGYHKQNPNRLLEPFTWIDTLITATDWDNFLWLRDHEHAEPHLQDLARLVKLAIDEAEIKTLEQGDWHIPYISSMDIHGLIIHPDKDTKQIIAELGCNGRELLNMVSAARCARISYKPFDGNATYRAEFNRYNLLVSSDRVHASPLEHQATPDHPVAIVFTGRKHKVPSKKEVRWNAPHLHGNLEGYIQARKLVPNEHYVS